MGLWTWIAIALSTIAVSALVSLLIARILKGNYWGACGIPTALPRNRRPGDNRLPKGCPAPERSSADLAGPPAAILPRALPRWVAQNKGGLPVCAATHAGSPRRRRLSNGRRTNCRAAAWAHLPLFSSRSVLSMSWRS